MPLNICFYGAASLWLLYDVVWMYTLFSNIVFDRYVFFLFFGLKFIGLFFLEAIVLALVKLKVVTITGKNILSIMETLAL